MSTLPDGWAEVRLSELGDWRGGGTPSKSLRAYWEGGSIPWVSPKDMKRPVISDAEDKITEAAVSGSATQLIPTSSVLIVTRSGILRHSLPVAVNARPVTINQDLKALTPVAAVSAEYIALQLRGKANAILSDCAKSGTTVDSINFERLKEFPFAVAPLNEQRRIVAKIVTLSMKSKRACAELDSVPNLVDKFKQAIFAAEYGKDLERTKDHLGSMLKTKPQNGLYLPKDRYGSGVPILRIQNYDLERVEPINRWRRVCIDESANVLYGLSPNDLIINRVNSPSHLGKCLVITQAEAGAVFESNMMRMSLASHVDPQYVRYYLNSDLGRRSLTKNAKWAVNQASINQGDVLGAVVPCPSLARQRATVRHILKSLAWIDRLAAEATSARKLIDRLDQAVLDKAFRGELVPQDPTDEPASALLERIRAERVGAPAAKRRGRPLAPRLP